MVEGGEIVVKKKWVTWKEIVSKASWSERSDKGEFAKVVMLWKDYLEGMKFQEPLG